MAAAAGIKAGRAYVEVGTNDSALARGLRAAERKIAAWGQGIQSVGRDLLGLSAAAATPLAIGAKTAADFESAMARVKALTNASGDEFSQLSGLAKKLGADTIFSATEAAQAMGNFAQAGFSVEEIMAATGPTLDLAATAQIGIADAASIATKVMRGMGIAATDLGGVVDVMAKAATTANTDITMLGDAFKFVGPIAKTAGISLEEITAAIQLLSNAGIQGEMAGTTLRGMILSLTSPTEKGSKVLDSLGVRIQDSEGNFVGLTNVIAQFQKALGGMGNAQKLDVLGQIFGDRQAVGMVELLAQGSERLADATAKLGDSAGTAARVAGVQMDTLRGDTDVLMSSLEGVAIEIGTALTPLLRGWAGSLATAANAVAAVAQNNQGLIVTLAKGVAVVAAVGAGLYAAGLAAKALAAGLGILGAVVGVVTSPVGLLVAGLAAAAVAFVTLTDTGAALFADLSATVSESIGAMGEALKSGDLQAAGQILWATLKVEWLKGVDALNAVWNDWGLAVRQVFADASTWIAGAMIDLSTALQATWEGIIHTFTGSWGGMVSTLIKTFMPLVQYLADFFGVDIGQLVDQGLASLGVNPGDQAAADQAYQDRLAAIGQNNIDQHAALNDQAAAATEARRQAALASTAGSAADLQAAQDELNSLINPPSGPPGDANQFLKDLELFQQVEEFLNGGKGGGLAGSLAGAGLTPDGLDQAVQSAAAKVDVAGGFSAAAVAGLGVGDTVANEQLKESKKQSTELEKLNRKADVGRLVFAS